jgi:hypothetical protein
MNREYRRATERALKHQWHRNGMSGDIEAGLEPRHHITATANRGGAEVATAGEAAIPFHRASDVYVESFFTASVTPGASQQESQPYNIPPGGFLRGIKLTVTCSGGTLGSATLAADYPWNIFKSIVVEDINGSPLFGPLEGYLFYLVNKYGGHSFQGDPAALPNYVGTINAVFTLWIPFEIRSDGLGSLANTDSRAQYRLRYTIAPSSELTGSTITSFVAPTVSIVGTMHTWSQVEERSMDGTPQEQTPPGLATTQFWTREQPGVAAASQTVKHNRVGNLIRNLIYVTRTNAAIGATTQANPRADLLTDPIRLRLDNRYLRVDTVANRIDEMGRKYGLSTFCTTRETGVYVYSWADGPDHHPSPADDSDYLETAEATFLQLEATFSGAGTLTVLTNDIAPYGTIPA